MPPLDNSDLVSLGLKPKDTIPTPVGPPQTIVNITLTPIVKNLFNVRIEAAAGQQFDTRAEYGFALHYGILPPGGATAEQQMEKQYLMRESLSLAELPKSKFTRRKKETLNHPTKPPSCSSRSAPATKTRKATLACGAARLLGPSSRNKK